MTEITLSPDQSRDIARAQGDVVIKDSEGNPVGVLHRPEVSEPGEPLPLTHEEYLAIWERSQTPLDEFLTTDQALQRLREIASR